MGQHLSYRHVAARLMPALLLAALATLPVRAQEGLPESPWGLRGAAGIFPAGAYLAGELSYRTPWLGDDLELFAGYATTPLDLTRHSLFAGLRYYFLTPAESQAVWDPYLSLSSNLILGPQGGWVPFHLGLGTSMKLSEHFELLWTLFPISLQVEGGLRYRF